MSSAEMGQPSLIHGVFGLSGILKNAEYAVFCLFISISLSSW